MNYKLAKVIREYMEEPVTTKRSDEVSYEPKAGIRIHLYDIYGDLYVVDAVIHTAASLAHPTILSRGFDGVEREVSSDVYGAQGAEFVILRHVETIR